MANLYFITGACGVGKTSIIPYLKEKLPGFNIHDFDEVGVPENPTVKWRKETTSHWIRIAAENAKKDISSIIVGLIIPHEVQESAYKRSAPSTYYCLLDITKETRAERLGKRGASKELIEDLEELIGLRKLVPESGFEYIVIDTTHLTPEEISDNIINWIKKINTPKQQVNTPRKIEDFKY